MGRQTSDSTVVHSSIALLQERFRQLERVKELREERQLLRLFGGEVERPNQATHYEPSKLFLHPDLILPSRPLQGSISLRHGSQGKNNGFRPVETPLLTTLWPDRPEDTEVDTSLHL